MNEKLLDEWDNRPLDWWRWDGRKYNERELSILENLQKSGYIVTRDGVSIQKLVNDREIRLQQLEEREIRAILEI